MFDSKAGLGQNPAHLTAQVKVAEFPEFNLEVPTALCNIYFFYARCAYSIQKRQPIGRTILQDPEEHKFSTR